MNNNFKLEQVFLGMVENQVENYKVIGIRDMNMNDDLKNLFRRIDPRDIIRKPYFNDAKETFRISYHESYEINFWF